jgi:hypothetical protein
VAEQELLVEQRALLLVPAGGRQAAVDVGDDPADTLS